MLKRQLKGFNGIDRLFPWVILRSALNAKLIVLSMLSKEILGLLSVRTAYEN